MKVIEYFGCRDSGHWLSRMQKCDWRAGQYLCELLREKKFKNIFGENSKVLLLADRSELISFCTYSEIDDIQPTDLKPWIGFVYTFPEYRNRGCAGMLLGHCEELAKK